MAHRGFNGARGGRMAGSGVGGRTTTDHRAELDADRHSLEVGIVLPGGLQSAVWRTLDPVRQTAMNGRERAAPKETRVLRLSQCRKIRFSQHTAHAGPRRTFKKEGAPYPVYSL